MTANEPRPGAVEPRKPALVLVSDPNDPQALRANEILNHPAVRPNLLFDQGQGIDIRPVIRGVVLLMSRNGGFIFDPLEVEEDGAPPQGVVLHSFFLPEGRGHEAHGAAWEAAEYLFTRHWIVDIFTLTAADRPETRPPRSMGFQEHFTRRGIVTRDGAPVDLVYWRLNIWDWAARAKGLETDGALFHDMLAQKRAALGMKHVPHAHDEAHDRYVGLAVRMWRHGLTAKAIRAYNYFAKWSGYQRMRIVGQRPDCFLIDLGDGLIEADRRRFAFNVIPDAAIVDRGDGAPVEVVDVPDKPAMN